MPITQKDIAIIGAGPVGLFTVFQAGMMGMSSVVIDALPGLGGQCSALYPEKPIYDIGGLPNITAQSLVDNLAKQASPFAPSYILGEKVVSVEDGFIIRTDKDSEIHAKALIIAAGCGAFGANRPPLDGLEAYEDSGTVRYMVQKKQEFAGKDIVIAGGGDSAVDWALSLAEIAKSTTLVHRRAKFRAAPDSLRRLDILASEGKISLAVPYQLHSLNGSNGKLEEVVVADLDGTQKNLKADYLLPFYGLATSLGAIADWGLDVEGSTIQVNPTTLQTNRAGIYAVGDICSYNNKLKLIACGFSESALAIHHAYNVVNPDKEYHFEHSTTKGVNNG